MELDPASGQFPPPSELPERPGLPDPLQRGDGSPVETAEAWRDRRSELEALFRHYVYGHDPGSVPTDVDVERTTGVLGGAATLYEATIRTDLPGGGHALTLALFVPAGHEPVPVFLGLNARGNHATVTDEAVTVTEAGRRFGAVARGTTRYDWCVEYLLERGYGFATVHCEAIEPDDPDASGGVRDAVDPADLPGPRGTEWGTIAAWAWGLSRCVDALRSADVVRPDEIAVLGHSRCGKAALLAGATDERIGLVVPHQSGTGGTTLSRENDQETVAAITGSFPHWFADRFADFADREARLPVDQHCLVAMAAPRPLLDTAGARDEWTNPDRALASLRAAAPVWEFLGAEGLVGDGLVRERAAFDGGLAGSLCQYRIDTGSLPDRLLWRGFRLVGFPPPPHLVGHELDRAYWQGILDFADCQFD